MSTSLSQTTWRSPAVIIVAGCLIAMIGFGIRSAFGLFIEPMGVDRGWNRETLGLAFALQNLLWGIGLPIAGALNDKYGPTKVIGAGAIVYTLGIWGMNGAESVFTLHLFAGLITGIGVAFTAFSLAMVAMARAVGPEKRSLILGVGTAAGSFGQVVFSPLTQALISNYGWNDSLLILAGCSLIIIPLALLLPPIGASAEQREDDKQTLREALHEALSHRGYVLLTIGFFVCGFHVAFITVHFPAYVIDLGLKAEVGAYAIAIVGLLNILGSFVSGMVGQRYSKRSSLAFIYFARSLVILWFLFAPISPTTIYLFAGMMGILWLSTVPLTTGIVAQVFGVRYMATLFGIVFLSHQIGSFMGIWLGGRIYDSTGSYDGMWWAGVVVGILAAIIHLPINEKPLPRLTASSTAS
ncbi:MAG: MFS transporter [Pseudomonadota bacterium]